MLILVISHYRDLLEKPPASKKQNPTYERNKGESNKMLGDKLTITAPKEHSEVRTKDSYVWHIWIKLLLAVWIDAGAAALA